MHALQPGLNIKLYSLLLVCLGSFVLAYYPALETLVSKWADSEEYSHAFFTIPIIGYMVWQKRNVFRQDLITVWPGYIFVIFSALVYPFALLTQVHTIILVALFMTIVGSVIVLSGVGGVKDLFIPLLLFLLLIPIPDQLLTQITFPMQMMVSQLAEQALSLTDITFIRLGNIFETADRRFEVVEACSGLRSVLALVTLSIIISYFSLNRVISRIILLGVSIPIAIVVNSVRIIVMIISYHYWQIDLVDGKYHSLTGVIVFGLALFLLIVIQKILATWEEQSKSI